MSKTKNELKREIKNIKAICGWAMKTKCIGCLGFFADRELCDQTDCPLYPFTFKRGDLQTKIFKRLIEIYKKVLKDDKCPKSSFWLEVLQKEILGSRNGVKKP